MRKGKGKTIDEAAFNAIKNSINSPLGKRSTGKEIAESWGYAASTISLINTSDSFEEYKVKRDRKNGRDNRKNIGGGWREES